MESITFFDTEIEPNSGRILDIGGIKSDGSSFHSCFVSEFIKFLRGSKYVCGHNIFNHDLKYIQDSIDAAGLTGIKFIDTLLLSPLLFPTKPYHALLKDDKLQTEEINNPLNDSIKTRDLFFAEVTAFQQFDDTLKKIFHSLLKDQKEFRAFFHFVGYQDNEINIENIIRDKFHSQMCGHVDIANLILESPIEVAYSLSLINTQDRHSITPPWVLKNYPAVQRIMFLLTSNPCLHGCVYCNEALDVKKGLKQFFGYDCYRTFEGEPLQEEAAKAAIANKSLLAVFPTGGGKSIAFQVPALMSGNNSRGLTVVISPLQSLMKDQVDNLEKAGITDAVTVNGLQNPIERANALERVEDGSASLLYIAPESLRSRTIEHLLLGRNVVRFVVDEAHCFSSWGQDFRVDYLYIGDFIKSIQDQKNSEDGIPVSCFTATAKPKVIEDIRDYFRDKLSLEMEVYVSKARRTNLHYKVVETEKEEGKYNTLRELIEKKKCPTIIYVSRTHTAEKLADRLTADGYPARPYHGQMDKDEKSMNQDAFIKGDIQIMVATTAFGMGVDKKDVGMVIHYEISSSLENYVQESGRAGRGETISADCFILFNDEDLNKHFMLLNRDKMSIKEIQQIWKAVKGITRLRSEVSRSALEIARKAGWDDSVKDIETRVKTAIAALEDTGYLKRGQNVPRIYATGILVKNAQEAVERINASDKFDATQKQNAVRIMRSLISSRSIKKASNEMAETRVDYISDRLAIEKYDVVEIINLLRAEKILADTKDLSVSIDKSENQNHDLKIVETYSKIEKYLLNILGDEEKVFNIKELNEQAEGQGYKNVTPDRILTILNFWAISKWIKKQTRDYAKNHIAIHVLQRKDSLEERTTLRYELAKFIVGYLYDKNSQNNMLGPGNKEVVIVDFSVTEIKEEFERKPTLFKPKITPNQVEDAVFYLSKIGALSIEGGFLVVYNGLSLKRLELNNQRRYKTEDYQKLDQYYKNRIEQIHIVGEYARMMINNYQAALQFADDYFRLNYSSFLNKYFKSARQDEIGRNITPTKFNQLFGTLSTTQLNIIKDDSKYVVVAAGPGSGKTRILVHKLASLLLMEDVKKEQLLMLTFSRAAATVFKKRLLELIGTPANFIEIKTFHSYCFDLLGKVGTLEKSDEIPQETVKRIKSGEVEPKRITKTVLVIDEAQDMSSNEFGLIQALMEQNEEMRLIAVGDDDQNIFEFRNANSKYMEKLILEYKATRYELVENFRSKSNIVDFSNQFVERIKHRLKNNPIMPVNPKNGRIKLVRYNGCDLITPTVNDVVSAELMGTTGVLTMTNEEALKITGLLSKKGFPAKLVQSNRGFNLYDLLEVRYFLDQFKLAGDVNIINDDMWADAKRKLKEKFGGSSNLEICQNLIRDFEATNPMSKYKQDVEIFVRESNLEDFYGDSGETIMVSTIHKAKGREFDNVFLMLNQINVGTDDKLRQLYVAMTRAKTNLTIHYNGNYLETIKTKDLINVLDNTTYSPPNQLVIQLTHEDVWLDFFASRQPLISQLKTGDELTIEGEYCSNIKGLPILKFSKQFTDKINNIEQNYKPNPARIRFIVYWKKKDSTEDEIKIILPELYFERKN
jgi:ATP-dependent DNA helicase RecQ